MIPIEVKEPSPWVMFQRTNSQALLEEADLANEAREMAHLREKALKHWRANPYNAEVIPQKFGKGDLVLRHANIGPPHPGQGKLATNWKGPYQIAEVLGNGAYKLSTLSGSEILRSWNSSNLQRFFI